MNVRKINRKIQKLLFREQWSLLVCDRDGKILKHIAPPPDRIWADPFPVETGGKLYIFIEQQRAGDRGTLGYIELFDDHSHSDFMPVLEEKWHLSYPQVFSLNTGGKDEWFMVPESADCGQVRLYRAESFPDRWLFVKELIPGIVAVDSTIFFYEGIWWLFTSQKSADAGFNSALYAYWTRDIIADGWTPHSQNPIVKGFANSRMAGRVTVDTEGFHMRPAQSCTREYGECLNLNRIVKLTPNEYEERTVATVYPEKDIKAVCTHTWNRSSRYVLRDVKTREFDPLHRISSFIHGNSK